MMQVKILSTLLFLLLVCVRQVLLDSAEEENALLKDEKRFLLEKMQELLNEVDSEKAEKQKYKDLLNQNLVEEINVRDRGIQELLGRADTAEQLLEQCRQDCKRSYSEEACKEVIENLEAHINTLKEERDRQQNLYKEAMDNNEAMTEKLDECGTSVNLMSEKNDELAKEFLAYKRTAADQIFSMTNKIQELEKATDPTMLEELKKEWKSEDQLTIQSLQAEISALEQKLIDKADVPHDRQVSEQFYEYKVKADEEIAYWKNKATELEEKANAVDEFQILAKNAKEEAEIAKKQEESLKLAADSLKKQLETMQSDNEMLQQSAKENSNMIKTLGEENNFLEIEKERMRLLVDDISREMSRPDDLVESIKSLVQQKTPPKLEEVKEQDEAVVEKLTEELQKATDRVSQLEKENSELTKQSEASQKELKREEQLLESQKEKTEETQENWKEKYTQLEGENSKLKKELHLTAIRLEEFEEKAHEYNAEAEVAAQVEEQSIKDTKETIQSIQAKSEQAKKVLENKIFQANDRIEAITSELEAKTKEATQSKTQLEEAKTELKKLEMEAREATEREVKPLLEKIRLLEQTVDEKKSELETKETRISELSQNIEELSKQLEELKDRLVKETETAKEEIEALQSKLDQNQISITTLESTVISKDKEIFVVRDDLHRMRLEAQQAENYALDAKDKIEELEAEVAKANSEVETLKAESDSLKKEIEEYKEAKISIATAQEKASLEMSEEIALRQKQKMEDLEKELETKESELKQKSSEIDGLKEKEHELQRELAAANKALQEYSEQIARLEKQGVQYPESVKRYDDDLSSKDSSNYSDLKLKLLSISRDIQAIRDNFPDEISRIQSKKVYNSENEVVEHINSALEELNTSLQRNVENSKKLSSMSKGLSEAKEQGFKVEEVSEEAHEESGLSWAFHSVYDKLSGLVNFSSDDNKEDNQDSSKKNSKKSAKDKMDKLVKDLTELKSQNENYRQTIAEMSSEVKKLNVTAERNSSQASGTPAINSLEHFKNTVLGLVHRSTSLSKKNKKLAATVAKLSAHLEIAKQEGFEIHEHHDIVEDEDHHEDMSFFKRAYAKIANLTQQLNVFKKYPRKAQIEAAKATQIVPTTSTDDNESEAESKVNELLVELDQAYVRLKEQETIIQMMSASMQSYKSKYPEEMKEIETRTQKVTAAEVNQDISDMMEELEEAYLSNRKLKRQVEELTNELDNVHRNSGNTKHVKNPSAQDSEGDSFEQSKTTRTKSLLSRAYSRIAELSSKLFSDKIKAEEEPDILKRYRARVENSEELKTENEKQLYRSTVHEILDELDREQSKIVELETEVSSLKDQLEAEKAMHQDPDVAGDSVDSSSSKRQIFKGIIEKAYSKIRTLTDKLRKEKKFAREEDIKYAKSLVAQGNEPQTEEGEKIKELLEEMDQTYVKLREYETTIQLLSKSIQGYKQRYPHDMEEVKVRPDNVTNVEFNEDIHEVLEELEEQYIKNKQLETTVANLADQIELLRAQVPNTNEQSQEMEGVDSHKKSESPLVDLLKRTYEKVKTLGAELAHFKKPSSRVRNQVVRVQKQETNQETESEAESKVNELLVELDAAYAKLKEYETTIQLLSQSMQTYRDKHPEGLDELKVRTQNITQIELKEDFHEVLEELEQEYTRNQKLQAEVDTLKHQVEVLAHSLEEAHNDQSSHSENVTQDSPQKKKKSLFKKTLEKITHAVKENVAKAKRPFANLFERSIKRSSDHSKSGSSKRVQELLTELDHAYSKLKEYEETIHQLTFNVEKMKQLHPDQMDRVSIPEGNMTTAEFKVEMFDIFDELNEAYDKISLLEQENQDLKTQVTLYIDEDPSVISKIMASAPTQTILNYFSSFASKLSGDDSKNISISNSEMRTLVKLLHQKDSYISHLTFDLEALQSQLSLAHKRISGLKEDYLDAKHLATNLTHRLEDAWKVHHKDVAFKQLQNDYLLSLKRIHIRDNRIEELKNELVSKIEDSRRRQRAIVNMVRAGNATVIDTEDTLKFKELLEELDEAYLIIKKIETEKEQLSERLNASIQTVQANPSEVKVEKTEPAKPEGFKQANESIQSSSASAQQSDIEPIIKLLNQKDHYIEVLEQKEVELQKKVMQTEAELIVLFKRLKSKNRLRDGDDPRIEELSDKLKEVEYVEENDENDIEILRFELKAALKQVEEKDNALKSLESHMDKVFIPSNNTTETVTREQQEYSTIKSFINKTRAAWSGLFTTIRPKVDSTRFYDLIPVSYTLFNKIITEKGTHVPRGYKESRRAALDQSITAEMYLDLNDTVLHLRNRTESSVVFMNAVVDMIEFYKREAANSGSAEYTNPEVPTPEQLLEEKRANAKRAEQILERNRVNAQQAGVVNETVSAINLEELRNAEIKLKARDAIIRELTLKNDQSKAEYLSLLRMVETKCPQVLYPQRSMEQETRYHPSYERQQNQYEEPIETGTRVPPTQPRPDVVNEREVNFSPTGSREDHRYDRPRIGHYEQCISLGNSPRYCAEGNPADSRYSSTFDEQLFGSVIQHSEKDYSSIQISAPLKHNLGVQIFTIVNSFDPESNFMLASVWDHHHNYLVKLDIMRDSQQILYKSRQDLHLDGDFEKIIVDVMQVSDKVVICDRDNRVKVFAGSVKIHEFRNPCFFQKFDYYAMSKVFTSVDEKLFYISGESRAKVVMVDMMNPGFPETTITFPQGDLFQISYSSNGILVGVGEITGILSFYDYKRRMFIENLQLPTDFAYRTLESKGGITVVNGVRNNVYTTDNMQILIGRDLKVASTNTMSFEGGNLGKYIHKMKLAYLEGSGLPILAMVSHHYEAANLYLMGFDDSKNFIVLKEFIGLHSKWIWDVSYHSGAFYVASSDGSFSTIRVGAL